ncbi:MAG: hypothetical protein H6622_14320 [Halobacteriovoraceae bacterium]|nr:hypothetical protein [Halobacteriovoraceae bacterium]
MILEREQEGNLVELKKWKEDHEEKYDSRSYIEYLTVLTFNQLIDESHYTAEELKKMPLSRALTRRSHEILNELNKRLNRNIQG